MTDKHADERPTRKLPPKRPGILQFTLLEILRRRKALLDFLSGLWVPELVAVGPSGFNMHSESQRPELPHQFRSEREEPSGDDYIDIEGSRDQVRAAVLQTLPPECREIYLARCDDDLSVEEIAILLNISENRVKAMLKVATKAIWRAAQGRENPSSSEPNR